VRCYTLEGQTKVESTVWNDLPDKVVNAESLLTFKKNLDGFVDERGVEGYGPSAGQWDEAKMVRHRREGPKGLFLSCNFLWFYGSIRIDLVLALKF